MPPSIHENLSTLELYRNCPERCPKKLVDDIVHAISGEFSVYRAEHENAKSGYICSGSQGHVIQVCVESVVGREYLALKIAKPSNNPNKVVRSLKRDDFDTIPSPTDLRFIDSCSIQRHLDRLTHGKKLNFMIPPVYKSGSTPIPYIAMEYIFSEPFLRVLADRNDLIYSLTMFQKCLEAVHFCNANGIIHRDCKSANFLIQRTSPSDESQDIAVLIDFGLATTKKEGGITGSGQSLGSFPYGAPECLLGHTQLAGPYTDVHGLGYMLHEAILMRQVPDVKIMPRDMVEVGNYRTARANELKEPFRKIFLKATHPDMDERYQDCGIFMGVIEDAIAELRSKKREQNYIDTIISPEPVIEAVEIPAHKEKQVISKKNNFTAAKFTNRYIKQEENSDAKTTEKITYPEEIDEAKLESERLAKQQAAEEAKIIFVSGYETILNEIENCKECDGKQSELLCSWCKFGRKKQLRDTERLLEKIFVDI